MVRDPIERIESHWLNCKIMGWPKIIASQNTHIVGIKRIKTCQKLSIGTSSVRFIDKDLHSYLNILGTLCIEKQSHLGRGVKFEIAPGATVILKGCSIGSSVFRIFHYLEIGTDTLISRDCEFIDDNVHSIIKSEEFSSNLNELSSRLDNDNNSDKLVPQCTSHHSSYSGIVIGNHVWINPGCRILPNVFIADNCVVATGSIVTKSFPEKNCLIAGVPARVIRKNIAWKS